MTSLLAVASLLRRRNQVAVAVSKSFEALNRFVPGFEGGLLDAPDEFVHCRRDRFVVEVDVVLPRIPRDGLSLVDHRLPSPG